MDVKDLSIESALGAQTNDGSTKYAPSGPALQTNGSKPYHDIGSNPLAKVDVSTARPCAIIGPDRVVPPHSTNDIYLKKASVEPWPCTDNIYHQPPEYPYKPADYPPSRNISPRQTFQENMQRIMVPPMYGTVKSNEDHGLKNSKLMPSEAKYCDVLYTISPINNEAKMIKNPDGLVPNNSSTYVQPVTAQGWLGSGVNVRPIRPYAAPEFYQYSELPNCSGPRQISMIRPHRNIHEDVPQIYQDRFYPAPNIRFKPYPSTKERHHQYPQARYEYIPNYSNTFHLHSPYTPHKYDLQKGMPPHPCPVYPAMPLKYLDKRMPPSHMDRYQRASNQQINFNPPICNQNIPPYGSIPGNTLPNRTYPYTPDPSTKPMLQNRLYFDNNNAHKYFPSSENMYINDINQPQPLKNDILYPPYSPINISGLPHHMYRKENPLKGYEHSTHYRSFEYTAKSNPMSRVPLQFSPQTISISPDSNTSNDTIQTISSVQGDCGYVSQSSTASVKSIESGVNRMSSDIYRHRDMRCETLSHVKKPAQKLDTNPNRRDKKGLNVRQFLQMWNEGDDEGNDNNKETSVLMESSNTLGHCETVVNQEQLYVLGLVNVPNEELDKYDHIQKISKLPENIKGYNSIELLNQYEKLVESRSNNNHFSLPPQQTKHRDMHGSVRNTIPKQAMSMLPRPISPLDVEAKISQSVIHKEVGCNFEIRPCSPHMMNVEVATPVHNVLDERLIEKVVNPVIPKSPMIQRRDENVSDEVSRSSPQIQSCKMVNTLYPSPNIGGSLKTNYCLQDLESNSGVGLASLPRLDNDIELNFPEINQQFIDANKIETIAMTSMRDLPVLDTDNSNINKNKISNKPLISENFNSGSESDKEVSKLSKYRKHKINTSIHRTDSVIIKNPENFKSHEEYSNIPLISKPNNDITLNSNIEVQSDRADNNDQNFNETVINKFNEYASQLTHTVDTAIDFSFSKNDEQGIYINSMGNLTDSLHINHNDVDKKLYPKDGVEELSDEKPKKWTEGSTSIELSSMELDSHPLDNFSCTSTLNANIETVLDKHTDKQAHTTNNEIDFDLIKDDTLPGSVVTHPMSKEKTSTEDFIQQKDLPILSQDDEENKCENINTNIALSNLSLNSDVKNQAMRHCLENDPNHLNTIHETNSNLIEADAVDQNYTNDMNVENNLDFEKEAKNITTIMSTNDVAEDNYQNIESSDIAKETLLVKCEIQQESKIPEENTLTKEIDIAMSGNEILVSRKETDENDSIHLENCLNVGFDTKCCDKIQTSQDSPNNFKGDITDTKNTNTDAFDTHCSEFDKKSNIELPSKINLGSTIFSSCSTILENNESVYEKSAKNELVDNSKKFDCKVINTFYSGEAININISDNENCYQENNESFFKKELFSPWFRNLLTHSDGLCTPLKNVDEKYISELKHSPKNNLPNSSDEDINILLLKPPEVISCRTNPSIANVDATSIEVPMNALTGLVLSETVSEEKHKSEVEECNINVDSDKVIQNKMTDDIKQSIDLIKSTDLGNSAMKSLIWLDEGQSDETESNNKEIENDNKTHATATEAPKECASLVEKIFRNQLPATRSRTFKRSLSESAVTNYIPATDNFKENYANNLIYAKRTKVDDSEILVESHMIDENLTSFIQSNRRNSISTIYNDENVSFCIVIDNDCVLTEENDDGSKICYTEIPSDCLTTLCTEVEAANSETTGIIPCEATENCEYGHELTLHNIEDKTIEESWIEDVACMETVFSDDIAEDIVISAPSSPTVFESSGDESENQEYEYNASENEHTNKVKHIYGNEMCADDAQLVEKLYRTPQMEVNKTLIGRQSRPNSYEYNDNQSLERILSGPKIVDTNSPLRTDTESDKSFILIREPVDDVYGNKENLKNSFFEHTPHNETYSTEVDLSNEVPNSLPDEKMTKNDDDCCVHSCESSCDTFVSYKKEDEKLHYAISSSPEVSSTTSEEKGSAILLKIRSYKGTKISEINETPAIFNQTNSSRFHNSNYNLPPSRPLLTKAAQKYIPPLKETIRDLKVKLHLPKQSLYKLKLLKKSKEDPKINTGCIKHYIKTSPHKYPKNSKPKPKFEDVLKSIDEIQCKKLKEKNKKSKQSIPKVIIKKNENGAHYASTQSKETFNPDLTGRKWQPWVFIEKNKFIDKMALRQKFNAIYSHRKKTYVLAESFRKYKSVSNSNFVITHPKPNDSMSTGKLKYTFRLKHN